MFDIRKDMPSTWDEERDDMFIYTLPETNIAPETAGLEDEFPFEKASWQVLC